jgi:quercetin dioxygenase-like cupin family protein
MTPSLQIDPYMLECDEGQRLESLGVLVVVKAGTEQTGGKFNLFEVTCPAGFATPQCIHYAEDVAVFVLEGSLTVFWGDEKKEATTGSYFFQPRGTPHGFRVSGEAPARMLYFSIPAGLDQFLQEHADPSDQAEPMIAAARHKIEILGPLPD